LKPQQRDLTPVLRRSVEAAEQQRASFVQTKVQIFLLAADFAAQRVEIKP
jgi:hypothetical protein